MDPKSPEREIEIVPVIEPVPEPEPLDPEPTREPANPRPEPDRSQEPTVRLTS